jgi:hypothetical protein
MSFFFLSLSTCPISLRHILAIYGHCYIYVSFLQLFYCRSNRISRANGKLILKHHSFIHSTMALQPFVEPWILLQFSKLFYTDGRTRWSSDQPVARPLPIYRTTQTQNKRKQYRHPCLEWDSNPRF